MDWDIKYRPRTLDELIGQDKAVATIKGWKHVPRCVLMSGCTGAGKTTTAGIVVREYLKVGPADLIEINCPKLDSPITKVREIDEEKGAYPIGGKHRVWIFDEVQALSRQKFAQQALLDLLEFSPEWDYYFLCTTDPQALLDPIRGRCKRVNFQPVAADELVPYLAKIAKLEKVSPAPEERLLDVIAENAKGSVREALATLQTVSGVADPKMRLELVERVGETKKAFDLAQELLPFKGAAVSWPAVAALLDELYSEDPEGLRQVILANARTCLLKKSSQSHVQMQAVKVIACLSDSFAAGKSEGHARLAAACYKICFVKRD